MTTDDLQALRAAAAELERIKQQNRARATRYLDRRKEAGKRQISAILHNDAYEEINKRRDRSIIEERPLTAGDIIEQALLATKDFIKLDGTIDIDLISDMAKAYDEQLYCMDVNTSVNISDNTKCDNPEDISETGSDLELNVCSDNTDDIANAEIEADPNNFENGYIEYDPEPDLIIEDIFSSSLELMPPVGSKTYAAWVKSIIKQLVTLDGITNKKIKDLLEDHNIQTAKGLDSWAIGTVGKYVAEAKRDKDK